MDNRIEVQLDHNGQVLRGFEINNEVVFTTASVPEHEMQYIENKYHSLVTHYYEEGVRIYVSPEEIRCEEEQSGVHDETKAFCPVLFDLIGIARALGCKWLVLDRDGPEVEGIKLYHW